MNSFEFTDSTVEAELKEHGVYVSVTKGASMYPLFKTNRDVIILKRPEENPKKYDVVLYKARSDKYILHRIVKVLEDKYVIRGDNTYVLEYIAKERIIGVLTEFTRKGRKRTVSSFGFRFYSRFWNFIYPIRFVFHKIRSFAYSIYRKLFKRK